jgi:cell division protein FtsI (penicillin-binding protein 3)
MEDKKNITWRIYMVYFGICATALIIVIQAVRIQIVPKEDMIKRIENLTTDLRTIEATRGNIYSDDGSLLATSIPMYEIRMDLKADGLKQDIFEKNIDSLCYYLARLFKDKTESQYRNKLLHARKEGNRYLLIQNKVNYNQLQQLKKFPLYKLGTHKSGLIVIKHEKRSRPYGLLAARLIGYERPDPNNPDYIVRVGLEGAYSKELSGINGKQLCKKIGSYWKPVNDEYDIIPIDGADIITTLDINIQDFAEKALLNQLTTHQAKNGCVVLMEIETGYVKAMANLSYDEKNKQYYEYYNQAIGVASEPGSTFKLASLLVALEDGYIKITDSVKTGNGTHKYFDFEMKDTKPHGTISIEEAFAYSSNIGISKPIYQYYAKNPKKFIDGLKKLELHEQLQLTIHGEAKPYIKETTDKTWSGLSIPQMAIGYEVKLTPLQILTFYNAIANNGKKMKPQFVKEIRRNGRLIKEFKPIVLNHQICSEKTIADAKKMMEAVVNYGTAKNLKAANFKIAGKTGTAKIKKERSGSYLNNFEYQASFVGYFPADAPKYSCIVVISAPDVSTGYYGNAVAGPVFKEIADKIYARSLEYHQKRDNELLLADKKLPQIKNGRKSDIETILNKLNLPSQTDDFGAEWVSVKNHEQYIALQRLNDQQNTIPDLHGMGLKDALYLLENKGLFVKAKGSGQVVYQSLQPGYKYQKGEIINIELR